MTTGKRPLIIAVAAALVTVVLAILLWPHGKDGLFASGTVEATEAQLGFPAAGRLQALLVQEGDSVVAGAEVARLDRSEAEARRNQAQAQADAARALLRELESGSRSEEIAQAKAAGDAASERLDEARRDRERTQILYDSGAVSREVYDRVVTAFDIAQSQHTQAAEQLRLVESGPRFEKIEAQRAQVAQAEAAVRSIDAQLQNMVIQTPFGGIVSVRHREPGEIVPAGTPVITLLNRDDRWVRIFIPEDRIGAVRIGQTAVVTADTYPDKEYRGEVAMIASQAEFTPKTVQTAEERVKLVYAVKVRITGDPSHDLKPGMPADVRLQPSS